MTSKIETVEAPGYHLIRMDRTNKHKPISEVHGDRLPDDPMYGVAFMQDGLPFDSNGDLVPPNKDHVKPWTAKTVDGKDTVHHPLYSEAMKKKLEQKISRLRGGVARPDPSDIEFDATDDINLETWLRTNVKVQPNEVFAAIFKRFHRRINTLRDAVDFLVNDEGILNPRQVNASLMSLVDKAA